MDYAIPLIKEFEGLYLKPYLCPAGVPTIGYGATYYEDGRRVALTDVSVSKEYAEELLKWHLNNVYIRAVMSLCPRISDPKRIGAIVDFTFNLGVNTLKNSTLRKKINNEEWEAVPTELRKWVKARKNGKLVILNGLVRRREAEIELI